MKNEIFPDIFNTAPAFRNEEDSLTNAICDYSPFDIFHYHQGDHVHRFTRPEFSSLLKLKENFWTREKLPHIVLAQLKERLKIARESLPFAAPLEELWESLEQQSPSTLISFLNGGKKKTSQINPSSLSLDSYLRGGNVRVEISSRFASSGETEGSTSSMENEYWGNEEDSDENGEEDSDENGEEGSDESGEEDSDESGEEGSELTEEESLDAEFVSAIFRSYIESQIILFSTIGSTP